MAQEIVEAPLTGKIISVEVRPGDKVNEGDTMVLLESMKMENPIVAPVGGTIIKVEASPGQIVKAGQVIIVIEL